MFGESIGWLHDFLIIPLITHFNGQYGVLMSINLTDNKRHERDFEPAAFFVVIRGFVKRVQSSLCRALCTLGAREEIMGYRAWRNVKKDLDKAKHKKEAIRQKAIDLYKRTGKIDPMLKIEYNLAVEDFWKCDQEALCYNAYTKWPSKRKKTKA